MFKHLDSKLPYSTKRNLQVVYVTRLGIHSTWWWKDLINYHELLWMGVRNYFFRVFLRWWWGHGDAMEFLNLGSWGCWKWQQGLARTNGRQWWDGEQWGMVMDTKKDDVWGALKGMTRVLGKMMSTLRRDQFEPPPMQRR